MQGYVLEEPYMPLRGLSEWLAPRCDESRGMVEAVRVSEEDVYTTRLVDIREPALVEPGRGYVFLRHGVYRPSFNWWQLDDGPHVRSFCEYAAWLLGRDRVRCLPEAVSFRTPWEENYWHCHDEVLSKLILVERMGLPGDIPLLIGSRLWNAPFFQEMRSAAGLRERNWIVHDTPVWAKRLVLCVQGPTRLENACFARDLFRDADAGFARATGAGAPLLFISRPRGITRHLGNDEELRRELARVGFRTVQPERLPFWEQVDCFRAARCVVLPHGAGLANLVHRVGSPTGLVELFPGEPEFLRRVYGPWLSREAGFAYRAVVGSPLSEGDDFTVTPDAVTRAVDAVLRELDGE
jgi:hypothetical protein